MGYSYLGDNSLYNITWYEIFQLIDAGELVADMADGVRESDVEKLEEFSKELEQQQEA